VSESALKVDFDLPATDDQAEISARRTLRSEPGGLRWSSPLGSRTSSQRIAPRRAAAIPDACHWHWTRRLFAVNRADAVAFARRLGIVEDGGELFQALALIAARPRRLRFCGGKANKLASSRKR